MNVVISRIHDVCETWRIRWGIGLLRASSIFSFLFLFDQNSRSRRFASRFVELERSRGTPRCVSIMADYQALHTARSFLRADSHRRGNRFLMVVNELRRAGGRSSVKASFIYIIQSASCSHRRRGDLAHVHEGACSVLLCRLLSPRYGNAVVGQVELFR